MGRDPLPPSSPPLFAEVAVDAPLGPGRTLTYAVPPALSVQEGHGVWVPLGGRASYGFVFRLTETSPVESPRPLLGVMDPLPLLTPHHRALAEWLSRTYLSSLFEAALLMAPPGFRRRLLTLYSPTPRGREASPASLPPALGRALDYICRQGVVEGRDLREALGRAGERAVRSLVARGLVERRWRWDRPRASPKMVGVLRLRVSPSEGEDLGRHLLDGRASRQGALLLTLVQEGPLPVTRARKEFGPSAVEGLLDKGLAEVEWHRELRDPLAGRTFPREAPRTLTEAQQEAVEAIVSALEGRSPHRAFLLQGPTGSGKTEVYLCALERCLALGKRGLFLVPEISLTPQFLQRLGGRFPGQVGLFHSGLSPGEQFDTWWRVRRGDFGVVVGPRSALFLPQPDLGLIVLDEEQEWTYKQQDASPRYDARTVALELARLTGAVVVFGSATPSLETYHRALTGQIRLLRLPGRIGPGPEGRPVPLPLPPVQVVDMREEVKAGNRGILSRALREALASALGRGEQALLFLNRRGSAPIVRCQDCGAVLRCRRCAISLTYHSADGKVVCHQCGERRDLPEGCPSCGGHLLRFLGWGTQRVAEEVVRLFRVSALRWDRDAVRERRTHEEVMERFRRGDAPVLVGTQMVAKGLHFPRVTVAGIVLADVGLHLPDFRAGERAFHLLCQVAGRAGREDLPGRVVLQTFSPDHYAVRAAAAQDYEAFYEREMEFRREHNLPPFSRLVRLLFRHPNLALCQREAERLAQHLRREREGRGLWEVDLIGPAPAFPERVRGHYRWHLLLRCPHARFDDLLALLRDTPIPQGWAVDVDPVSLV